MATNIFDKLRAGAETGSADASRALAAELARALPPNAILALHGDLGAGKTPFAQGLARGLGITGPVTSPTFNILTQHPAARPNTPTFLHLDAYRLENASALDGLMLEDFMLPPFVLVIEWPENIAAWLPTDALHLDLALLPDGRHSIRLR
ncbi:MAG: tRNA (adenosine(37)-N6)-threonylcarbamoyltransferase complex ATPase subunit type 1 TsaE [Opitutaceae bacterium]|jgi:tRNA threonylcarbamoyladenosine biosynthesis protein TsaE|nr:tRNA (adenosine(37)-N6)-threonylcarbamoyltransferase complex ATPase subunit type 1 TsaE [Opitutaceae bacterium]